MTMGRSDEDAPDANTSFLPLAGTSTDGDSDDAFAIDMDDAVGDLAHTGIELGRELSMSVPVNFHDSSSTTHSGPNSNSISSRSRRRSSASKYNILKRGSGTSMGKSADGLALPFGTRSSSFHNLMSACNGYVPGISGQGSGHMSGGIGSIGGTNERSGSGRRPSAGSVSVGEKSMSTFLMNVDISKNHGHGTVPIAGRESHTADLNEFDRYVKIMEETDRSDAELLFLNNDEGIDEEDENEEEERSGYLDAFRDDHGDDKACNEDGSIDQKHPPVIYSPKSKQKPKVKNESTPKQPQDNRPKMIPPIIGMDIEMNGLNLDDSNREDDPLDGAYDKNPIKNSGTNVNQEHGSSAVETSYPFNAKFWAYVRSILSNAKPVGFSELSDPNATIPKGPEDANAFISKVIAIAPINPIQPSVLAENGGFDEMEVLAELLFATCAGLVAMRFAPECVQCGSALMDTDMLGRIPGRAKCKGCNAPNVIDSLDKIKVMFLLNSDVLYVLAENYACTPSALSMSHTNVFAAVPATSTGSGFSYCVGTGKETEIAEALEPGKYRMHCPVALTDNYLVVRRKTEVKDEPVQLRMKVSDLVYQHEKSHKSKTVLHVPHGKIRFDILPDTRSFFVLWVQKDKDDKTLMHLPEEERSHFTSATKVMHHPIFNALFDEHQVVSVPKDIFFSVSNVVLVFTDIVDSTKLYASLGDGEAFRLVRKHFQVLFGAFTRKGGRVVKTIGDAVMASFTTGRAALQAVADAMEMLPKIGTRPDNNNCIEIRVGIHSGRATVVPLNGVNDYFGQTANIAARVQSSAKASECFVTETVLDTQDARDAYVEITKAGSAFKSTPLTELKLKGVEGKVHARGFRWVYRSRRQSDLSSSSASLMKYMERKNHHQTTRTEVEDVKVQSDNESLKYRSSQCMSEISDDDKFSENHKTFERPSELGRRRSSRLDTPDEEGY